MNEVTIGPAVYSIGRLSAFDQFHIGRRLSPLIGGFLQVIGKLDVESFKGKSNDEVVASLVEGNDFDFDAFLPLLDVFASLSDEDSEYIINKCLNVTGRKNTGGATGFAPVRKAGQVMFELTLPEMLIITFSTIKENMQDYFSASLLSTLGLEAEKTRA